MSRNFLNEDFGDEEDDEDFNPVATHDSDNEEERVKVGCCRAGVGWREK